MKKLGNKIMIVGSVASGKSTLARKITDITHIPTIFVDTILWKSNWVYIGDEAALEELDTLSQRDSWIIEGYVAPKIKDLLFHRADTILFLEYPRLITLFQYIKRWWQHRKNPRPELNGNTEKFRFKLIKRILQKEESSQLNKTLERNEFKNKVIKLTSPKETIEFLKNL
jgi:adenylate kinase family enzyme